jgi:hypothetical protein
VSSARRTEFVVVSQDAPQCQDTVTTRQDRPQTCRDVSAEMKPSSHVLRTHTERRTAALNPEAQTTLLERGPVATASNIAVTAPPRGAYLLVNPS